MSGHGCIRCLRCGNCHLCNPACPAEKLVLSLIETVELVKESRAMLREQMAIFEESANLRNQMRRKLLESVERDWPTPNVNAIARIRAGMALVFAAVYIRALADWCKRKAHELIGVAPPAAISCSDATAVEAARNTKESL